MTYFEGFVVAVPEANKDAYGKHASDAFPLFRDFGVTRLVEAWGDDVPDGKVTDFRGAVKAEQGENVVFSWFEYPSKEARNAANAKMMSDPRMAEMGADMPFDGKRMIMGGFDAIVEEGERGGSGSYTDGFVVPVPNEQREAYRALAARMAGTFRESGALRVVEAWGDDIAEGKVTDFRRAVKAEEGENVVFSFVEWPDKPTRDAAWKKMMEDPSMQGQEMPFDGKRMFWGGFEPIVDKVASERVDA
jgi:uncharacterized protein YbaA (DUF1428 family)